MSASEHAGLSQQLKMFLSTTEIMEGGWNRRSGGIFPKLAESVDKGAVESDDFRNKLLPVEYEEFPDANAPKYHEQGTHGQDMPEKRDYAEYQREQYANRTDEEKEATREKNRRNVPRAEAEVRHKADEVDEARKAIRNPDAFDSAFAELSDVTKVAAEMRSLGVEDWVIEERLLKELSVRSEMVSPENPNYIKGITWEDIESTGDRHKLEERVRNRRRRADMTPEQREAKTAGETKRRANWTSEQREVYRASEKERAAKRRAGMTPEQRERTNVTRRKADAKYRAKKKQEARESTWDDLEAPE